MRMLWPAGRDDVDVAAVYAADDRPGTATRPWVTVSMVSTADGSATDAAGVSGGLGNDADRRVFAALRATADVIVAGAGTVVAEDYGPSNPSPATVDRRVAEGRAPRPRIAVVTASLRIDPAHRLFRTSPPGARPLVLTVDEAPIDRRRALTAVAEVRSAGTRTFDWHIALRDLAADGVRTVLCEGGPATNASLIADDLVDELCLTVAPTLAGGAGPRIAAGPAAAAGGPVAGHDLALDRVLVEDDHLFLRYVRPPRRAGDR